LAARAPPGRRTGVGSRRRRGHPLTGTPAVRRWVQDTWPSTSASRRVMVLLVWPEAPARGPRRAETAVGAAVSARACGAGRRLLSGLDPVLAPWKGGLSKREIIAQACALGAFGAPTEDDRVGGPGDDRAAAGAGASGAGGVSPARVRPVGGIRTGGIRCLSQVPGSNQGGLLRFAPRNI